MLLWGFWLLVSSITYRCNFYFLFSISVAYYTAKKPYLVFTHVWWIWSCVSALGGCEFLGIWKGTVFDCLFQMSDETDTFRCHRLGNQMCIHVDIPVCLPAISLWLCWCVWAQWGIKEAVVLDWLLRDPPVAIWLMLLPAELQLVLTQSSTVCMSCFTSAFTNTVPRAGCNKKTDPPPPPPHPTNTSCLPWGCELIL